MSFIYFENQDAVTNLRFFLRHALHDHADFLFVINGHCSIINEIPARANIRVLQRQNNCFDLGTQSVVLKQDDLYKNYTKFILMNKSVRGPFLPYWSRDCWTDIFVKELNDKTKVLLADLPKMIDCFQLVGMTSNCHPRYHIQSMFLVTDRVGIELFLASWYCFPNKESAVKAEIETASIVESQGFEAISMLAYYHSNKTRYIEECLTTNGDLLYNNLYFGFNVHAFETIFYKTNRDIDPAMINHMTKWYDARNYSSYDYCRQPFVSTSTHANKL